MCFAKLKNGNSHFIVHQISIFILRLEKNPTTYAYCVLYLSPSLGINILPYNVKQQRFTVNSYRHP